MKRIDCNQYISQNSIFEKQLDRNWTMGEENVRHKELMIKMRLDMSDIGKFCIECVEGGNGMIILALL